MNVMFLLPDHFFGEGITSICPKKKPVAAATGLSAAAGPPPCDADDGGDP